jgi:hypothetical protein
MPTELSPIFKTPTAEDPALAEIVRRLVEVYQPDRSARSAMVRSLPFLASASIWASQASAPKLANQSRNAFSSSGLRLFT